MFRCTLGVIAPVFSYTGTIRPVCTVSPSSSSRISYCGFVNCTAEPYSSTLPYKTTRCPRMKTSLRYG